MGENTPIDLYFEDLLIRYLDDNLTKVEMNEFFSQLKESKEKRIMMAEYCLQATFIAEKQIFPLKQSKPKASIITFFKHRLMLVAMVAILLLSLLVTFSVRPTKKTYAFFKETPNAMWYGDAKFNEDSIGQGELIVSEGVIELNFINGVNAIFESPAKITIIDEMNVLITKGKAVFKVPPRAIGFSATTLSAKIIDLGTEFGVAVGNDQSTDIQVFEGQVRAAAIDEQQMTRLESGQAMRVNTDKNSYAIGFEFNRFVRYLPDVNDPEGRGSLPYNTPRLDKVYISPAPDKVTIDGDLSDWDLSGRFKTACDPPYSSFYYVEGSMMYDDQFLYIGAHVGDPYPMRSTILHTENLKGFGSGGAIALRLSLDRKMGWPSQGTFKDKLTPEDIAKLNKKLMFAVMWYERPTRTASLHLMTGMSYHNPSLNPSGYSGAFLKDPDGHGYTMEYKIPWSLLNAADDPPRGGDILGMTWVTHWSGSEGRNFKGQLVDIVNPSVKGWSFKDAATWGKAIYKSSPSAREEK